MTIPPQPVQPTAPLTALASPPAQAGPAVLCRALAKRFGTVDAVRDVDLEIRRGECFALLGPNGAGKTTTIEILEGLQRADAGEVRILGRTWEADAAWLRARIGISLQETRLSDKLTVYETVRVFRSFHPHGREVDSLLAELSLAEKRDSWVGRLSGGQRQRLDLACALVGQPDLLFLDEPTTGLDPQSRLQLWDHLSAFRAAGGTILLTTHYMDEAERLCDRVAIIDQGRTIAVGTPAELIATLPAAHVVEIASHPLPDGAALAALPGVRTCTRRGEAWSIAVSDLAVSVPPILALVDGQRARLLRFTTHPATLEDLFVAMTGRTLRDA